MNTTIETRQVPGTPPLAELAGPAIAYDRDGKIRHMVTGIGNQHGRFLLVVERLDEEQDAYEGTLHEMTGRGSRVLVREPYPCDGLAAFASLMGIVQNDTAMAHLLQR